MSVRRRRRDAWLAGLAGLALAPGIAQAQTVACTATTCIHEGIGAPAVLLQILPDEGAADCGATANRYRVQVPGETVTGVDLVCTGGNCNAIAGTSACVAAEQVGNVVEIRVDVGLPDVPGSGMPEIQAGQVEIHTQSLTDYTIDLQVPTIDALRPVVACPVFDRPGFLRGQPVGTEIPESQEFPQIHFVTVKACEDCDLIQPPAMAPRPIFVDNVDFEYQGDTQDGESCDEQEDVACDPAECSAFTGEAVWRRILDVRPFEASGDPLRTTTQAHNNLGQVSGPGRSEALMELSVQSTVEDRDAAGSPGGASDDQPLWMADPKGFLTDLLPLLAEWLGLEHLMSIEEELSLLDVSASIQVPGGDDEDTGGVAEGVPAVEEDADDSGGGFGVSAAGGVKYFMALSAAPGSFDLSANVDISGSLEVEVGLGSISCELVGADGSTSATDLQSLVEVFRNLELETLSIVCGGELDLYGKQIKIKQKAIRRYIEEISLALVGLIDGSATVSGGPPVDAYELVDFQIDPGLKGIASFEADIKVGEIDAEIVGILRLPIDYDPGGADCGSEPWCVKVAGTAYGNIAAEVRAGSFKLFAEEYPAGPKKAVIATIPSGKGISNTPADPATPAPPLPQRASQLLGTASVIDGQNGLWLAFVSDDGNGETSEIVVWRCGLDHACGSKTPHVVSDGTRFAHSVDIAINPLNDLPVVAWIESTPATTGLEASTVVLSTWTTTPLPGFSGTTTVVSAGGGGVGEVRYGLALDIESLAPDGRAHIVYVEDDDLTRFDSTSEPAELRDLPRNTIQLARMQLGGMATVTQASILTCIDGKLATDCVHDDPDVAADRLGRSVVVWDTFAPFAASAVGELPAPREILARVVDPFNVNVYQEYRITDNEYDDAMPSVEIDSAGNVLVAWRASVNARSSGSVDVNPTAGTPRTAVLSSRLDGGDHQDIWVYDASNSSAPFSQITSEPVDQRDAAIMDDVVVYSANQDGEPWADLWLLNLDEAFGPVPRRVRDEDRSQRMPDVHANGSTATVVYVESAQAGGPSDLWVVGPASTFGTGDTTGLLTATPTQLSATDYSEVHPAFNDDGTQIVYSAPMAMKVCQRNPYQSCQGSEDCPCPNGDCVSFPNACLTDPQIVDGCNLISMQVANQSLKQLTVDPGCETEPTWSGNHIVYRCDVPENQVERKRPEDPCQLRFEATAVGGLGACEGGDDDGASCYADADCGGGGVCTVERRYSWLVDDGSLQRVEGTCLGTSAGCSSDSDCGSGACVQPRQLAHYFTECSPQGSHVEHDVELTVEDGQGSSYTISMTVSTDGVNPPLRVDVDPSRGAVVRNGQDVSFEGRIAGGLPPYDVRFEFGDGGSTSFSSNGLATQFTSASPHTYSDVSSGPFRGYVEVRDSTGMTARREFEIDAGPPRDAAAPGAPLKAVARPRLPYQKRAREALCSIDFSFPPATGGPIDVITEFDLDTSNILVDARSPSLGPESAMGLDDRQLLYFERPAGNPRGVEDDLVTAPLSASLVGAPVPAFALPGQASLAAGQAVQYASFDVVRMAVMRLVNQGSLGVVGPPVDVSLPQRFARHPKLTAGAAGNFVVSFRADHLGGLEREVDANGSVTNVLIDGDARFSTGQVNRVAGALLGAQQTVSVAARGILSPNRFTTWRTTTAASPSGSAVVAWIDKGAPSNPAIDVIGFSPSLPLPATRWPSLPPFGGDGLGDFDLGGAVDGTYCPILASGFTTPWPWDTSSASTTGAAGTFVLPGDPALPPPSALVPGEGVVGVEFYNATGTVLPDGNVTLTADADVVWVSGGTQVMTIPGVEFTTGVLPANVDPGPDGTLCTGDDTASAMPQAHLLGQPVDGDGGVILVAQVPDPFPATSVDHHLFELRLAVGSDFLDCGNGAVDADLPHVEGCDDGNRAALDGCSGTCQIEPGWTCGGEPSACTEICGDGIVTSGEGCDDGALVPGDGCDASCQLEPGHACAGAPSICTEVCGDGIVTISEACDDGANDPGDCCSATCTFEPAGSPCGDGNLCTGNETCDGAGACVAGAPPACDDGDVCNGTELCEPLSGCASGTPLDCDDSDPCTADSCDAFSGCQHVPVGGPACNPPQIPLARNGVLVLLGWILAVAGLVAVRRRFTRA